MATVADQSAQLNSGDNQMWYYGGNQQGPAAPTNPIRQALGNAVEWAGQYLTPWKQEGYLSEMIAGGPTTYTGQVKATEPTGPGGYNPQPLATTTSPAPTNNNPAPQQSGGVPGVDMSFYQGWTDQNAINADWANTWQQKLGQSGGGAPAVDPYAQVKSDINSGYDTYIQSLNDQLNGLGGQQEGQNQIVDNQLSMGLNNLGLQNTQGQQQLAGQTSDVLSNQNKNLKSLDENLRNLFMAGNVYLGSRGAGDSSAANQYSYALTKQGNQARGDQMTQTAKSIAEIQARETNLKNIFDTETNNLKTTADNKKLEVAQWFADTQNQVKSAIASGQLSRSTDLANLSKSILDQAMQRLQQVQSEYTNRQNSLMTWAENNSSTINQLKANMQAVSSIAPTLASATSVNGNINTDARGNMSMNPLIGYGTTTEKKGLFG